MNLSLPYLQSLLPVNGFSRRLVILSRLVFGALLIAPCITIASNLPDYYSAPGFNPFREFDAFQANEAIDPFSGGLNLVYQDIVIPGNNGLDLVATRSYRSLSGKPGIPAADYKGWPSPMGLGWDMHFGRVWSDKLFGGSSQSVCRGDHNDANFNPVLELPDGTRKLMYNASSGSYAFISKDRWVMRCYSGGDQVKVYSPDGIVYTMGYYTNQAFLGASGAYHTTEISDTNGNKIKVDYLRDTQRALIQKAYFSGNSSVGIQFKYSEPKPGYYLLDSISANGRKWNYRFEQVYHGSLVVSGHYYLTDADPPAGNRFKYTYHTQGSGMTPGLFSLKTRQNPAGTITSYEYDFVRFYLDTDRYGTAPESTVVSSKRVSGGGVSRSDWSYRYFPGGSLRHDKTEVYGPYGMRTDYLHFSPARASNGSVWRIGTLIEKSTYQNGSLKRRESYTWEPEQLSSQNVKNRRVYLSQDQDVYTPLLATKVITQDGNSYTTSYKNHFDGKPTEISESGNQSRTIYLSYTSLINFSADKWKLASITRTSFSNLSGAITNQYDSNGNLTSTDRFGSTEYFSRCSNGEVAIYTNANSNKTHYNCSLYRLGIPQEEIRGYGTSNAMTITREVSNQGTILSETVNGNTTRYSYDGLNRLTSIFTPRSDDADISIQWDQTGTVQTVSRGTYQATKEFDGMGRLIWTNDEGLAKSFTYDELGRKSSESNLGDVTQRTYFSYDILNRLTKVDLPGEGASAYQYLQGNQVLQTDPRGYQTRMTFRAFGEPNEKALTRIISPEGVDTIIGRDGLDNITSVTQGGITRNYNYNSLYQLTQITHPEIGSEIFGRDMIGNMTSYQIGSNPATQYQYDALERLVKIDFGSANTPDITMAYDGSGNLVSLNRDNGQLWTYRYNANNVLNSETLTLVSEGKLFQFGYQRDALDNISAMSYPTGNVYQFTNDDLGRTTAIRTSTNKSVITNATYWPNGAVKDILYANGRVSSFVQDVRLRTTQALTSGGLFNTHYGYDPSNNLTSLLDQIDNTHSMQSLGYDGLNRLTHINQQSVLSYDAVSNIRTNKLANRNYTYDYDTANRLTRVGHSPYQFTYDSRGNVTSNGVDQFAYNLANEMTAVVNRNWTMEYDGNHYRTVQTKNGKKVFTVYANGKLMFEEDQSTDLVTDYLYLGRHAVARNDKCLGRDSDNDGIPNCIEVKFGLDPDNGNDAAGDIDSDGLPNLQEYLNGTRIDLADTDGDGITDRYEVENGMNPLVGDAYLDYDQDGLNNLEEFVAGTQANNPDTDDDGIPDGSDSNPLFNAAILIPIITLILN